MGNDIKPNGQGKKELERDALVAKKRIESINSSLESINKQLTDIRELLKANIKENKKITELSLWNEKQNEKGKPNDEPFYKNRNKLENTPYRLWFKMLGINYYIDFTIQCAKYDKETKLEGCFFYGTSYYIEKDKVEDKTIVSFFIDDNGIITSKSDFENESWTCEKDHIIDLHLRALDKIWEEALYLINKDKS